MQAYNSSKSYKLEMEQPFTDEYLAKQLSKLLFRIERILVPSNAIIVSDASSNLELLTRKIKRKDFFEDAIMVPTIAKKSSGKSSNQEWMRRRVKWDDLQRHIFDILSNGDPTYVIPKKIQDEIDTERNFQQDEESKLRAKLKMQSLQVQLKLNAIKSSSKFVFPIVLDYITC